MKSNSRDLPELLCPAGDLACLKAAVDFGADAVYLGGERFGMRTAPKNFTSDELEEGIAYAHGHGVAVHVTCNIVPHDGDLATLPAFLALLERLQADAIIVSDLGTMELAKRYAPHCDLHVSVQAGVANSETAKAFYRMGAKRVVLARELSLSEIAAIRANTPEELTLESFVHGAMCVSVSGRCLLSSYMTGRDANRGDCAQPCRWRYALMEQKRPGQLFEVAEEGDGTYFLNANDLCLMPYLDRLCEAGIGSLKIEGRAKSEYYVAVTANAYRGALDSLKNGTENWQAPAWALEELEKISHRTYSTGFYFGPPQNAQTYESAGYLRDYAVAAVVTGYENGWVRAVLKNKFLRGDLLDCLEAGSVPFAVTTDGLADENGTPIAEAPHPMREIRIPFARPIRVGSMLRKRLAEE